jgi:hypothetical protein
MAGSQDFRDGLIAYYGAMQIIADYEARRAAALTYYANRLNTTFPGFAVTCSFAWNSLVQHANDEVTTAFCTAHHGIAGGAYDDYHWRVCTLQIHSTINRDPSLTASPVSVQSFYPALQPSDPTVAGIEPERLFPWTPARTTDNCQ